MKSSAFIKIAADAYHVEEKTVQLYTRLMKEAGLITSGARGVNAPHMHPRDAVRLTMALLATSTAAHAVAMYQRFAAVTYLPDRSSGTIPVSLPVEAGDSLETVLLRLFSGNLEALSFNPYLEVQENQRIATIEFKWDNHAGEEEIAVLFFQTRNRPTEMAEADRKAHAGIKVSRGLSAASLTEFIAPFYSERAHKVSWETMCRETEEDKKRRIVEGKFKPESGLWFDRNLEEA